MRYTRSHSSASRGFTLVELMVVIVVVGILASIVMFSVAGWRKHTAETQVKSDLAAAASAMENYRNINNGYPTSLPSTFTASRGVVVTYTSGNALTYCINGSTTDVANVQFYIRVGSGASGIQAGTCS